MKLDQIYIGMWITIPMDDESVDFVLATEF
jgi:hypothetical protein